MLCITYDVHSAVIDPPALKKKGVSRLQQAAIIVDHPLERTGPGCSEGWLLR